MTNSDVRREDENTFRQEGELIKSYLHRLKSEVDKGWPEKIPASIVGNDNIWKAKEIQQRQRSQKYVDFAIRGLRPQGLKRKAHKKLIENPSISWTVCWSLNRKGLIIFCNNRI